MTASSGQSTVCQDGDSFRSKQAGIGGNQSEVENLSRGGQERVHGIAVTRADGRHRKGHVRRAALLLQRTLGAPWQPTRLDPGSTPTVSFPPRPYIPKR